MLKAIPEGMAVVRLFSRLQDQGQEMLRLLISFLATLSATGGAIAD